MEVHYVEVGWSEHAPRLRAIRHRVFIDEQGVPEAIEWDTEDESSRHFLAVNAAGQDLGCARLQPNGKLTRMAVHENARKQGVGAGLLRLALDTAQQDGHEKVVLHAQQQVVGFYERFGFREVGSPFTEAGIPHQAMELLLALTFAPPEVNRPSTTRASSPLTQPTSTPPPEAELVVFEGEEQAVSVLLEGLGYARRQLYVYTQALEPQVFDRVAVVDQLSQLVRQHPRSEIRLLVNQVQPLVARGHQLIDLAQRLSSKLTIRVADPDYADPEACFACWDEVGFWRLNNPREPRGSMNPNDPIRVQRMLEQFKSVWEHARTDPNLRVLRL